MVLNSRDASVSLIDQKTFTEVGRIDVGKEPHHLYPKPDGKSLIVANAMSNDLHFLDPVTGAPRQMRFSATGVPEFLDGSSYESALGIPSSSTAASGTRNWASTTTATAT